MTAARSRQTTTTVVPAILGAILGLAVLVFYSNSGTIAGGSFTIRNFDETKWVALSGVAILTNLFILLQRIQTVRIRINKIDVIIFLIFGWMGLSLLWSPDPKYGALAILYASLLLVFYCNSRAIHPEAINNFIHAVSLISLTGIMVIPILFDDFLLDRGFGNINFVAEFASISLCAALAFWNKGSPWLRRSTRFIVVAAAVDLFIFSGPAHEAFAGSDLQYVGLAVLALYLLFFFGNRRVFWIICALGGTATLILLITILSEQSPLLGKTISISITSRVQIWANSLVMGLEHPIRGWGLGSYLHSYPQFLQSYMDNFGFLGAPTYMGFAHLRAAVHNEFLQTWLELGLPGIFLALLLIVLLCRRLGRFDRDEPGLLYGGSLAVLMGVAMIGFPLQNPATGVLAAVIAGALSGRLQGSSGDDFEAPPDRPLILSLVSISVGLLALWQGRAELSAQWLMTRADILSRSGQIIAAVETLEQAIAVSDISPRLRTRLYPEVMAAGPRFWAKKYSSAQIESAYALAVSASPSNPVLLDMRLKYLTHLPDLPMPCSEVERMIKLFKRTTDAVAPNTHIMEAAFALRLNDLERTAAALARARAFTDPPMRPKRITKNYENNLRNIGYLEAAMEKRRQRRSEAGDRGTQADPEERSPPAGC